MLKYIMKILSEGGGILYISEKAPAKINLTLDVIKKREDNYHELTSVMTTIDLADRIDLFCSPTSNITLESSSGFVPRDCRNLAYRAAEVFRTSIGVRKGVHIKIDKKIPVAAGLAGGSSDAAATIRGLNRLWGIGLTLDEMCTIGEKIGSDVPFCIQANTSLATGRGEILNPLPAPPSCWVVLAKPRKGVSSTDVFGLIDLGSGLYHPDTLGMIEAIKSSNYDEIVSKLGNSLERTTIEISPEVKYLKQKILLFGADGVVMSGSGPTVYGIVKSEYKAKKIVNSLRGFSNQVYAVRMLG